MPRQRGGVRSRHTRAPNFIILESTRACPVARRRNAKIQWAERVQSIQPLDNITSDIAAGAQPASIFHKSPLVTAASHHRQNPAPRTGY
jgi:hypothetical protein